jgi:hypothetical protein
MTILDGGPPAVDLRFLGLHLGVVTDIGDPEGLGRVRLRIPGLVEPASGWAWPLATGGGGAAGCGLFAVPPVGADVGVLFAQADPDAPFWLAGPWGRPDGQSEVPFEGQAGPAVRVLSTPTLAVVLDERAGAQVLRLVNRRTGDTVVLDVATHTISIEATTELRLRAVGRISIDALSVTINGRPVAPSAEPI